MTPFNDDLLVFPAEDLIVIRDHHRDLLSSDGLAASFFQRHEAHINLFLTISY
ncbi:hypothetical protein ACIQW5_09180 [Methylorubrum thiocyanatum]|uniref:hypothetical protein n=1 Tax=Methylorubrum thiocyanatum TaxID=47958 RepID=UPI00383B7F07